MIKWRGIDWSVHPLFIILMLGAVVSGFFAEMITLFVLVLIHELGHVVAARYFGWTVKEVKLLPFGGVAEVEEAHGTTAREEMIIAAAGPLQNVWMGLIAYGLGEFSLVDEAWAHYLLQANLLIGLFNMLPIYPLDGGKIVQALFSYMVNYYSVMIWTMRTSLAGSVVIIIISLLPLLQPTKSIQLNLLIIGCFLFASNWSYHRNMPYLFFRFLMQRERLLHRQAEFGQAARPLLVHHEQSVMSVVKLFRRHQFHFIYLMDRRKKTMKMIPEQLLLEHCLSGGNPARAVAELFG
ncbi:M50 family metallopeptidase [Paenibacillus yanchengensis]|uniref:M50 family metallopeptidase n=1 Tax=Paenibacillus yanchengensis TaxID=2035833 RepID=A0ABW4YLC0_9BACL